MQDDEHPSLPPPAPPPSCVVCAKQGGRGRECAEGVWKHGLHLYWPGIVVRVEQERSREK